MSAAKPLPQSYWVEEPWLCAGQYPGHPSPSEADVKLKGLLDAGIRRVINLMEPDEVGAGNAPFTPYAPRLEALASARGETVEFANFPIRDAGIPTLEMARRILAVLDDAFVRRVPTYVHCWGGHGRTGTIVACFLISRGLSAAAAIERIMSLRHGLPKSHFPFEGRQVDFIRSWSNPPAPVGSVIRTLLEQGLDPRRETELGRELSASLERIRTGRRLDRAVVKRAELRVAADPRGAFSFGDHDDARLHFEDREIVAGRFETPSIGELRERSTSRKGPVRLWTLLGNSPLSDIGSLQATTPEALFQVASQFNALEAPVPRLSPVASYFNDSTQGPRAAISAWSGTLLRHYAAPDGRGGRFTQTEGGRQLNLLADIEREGLPRVRSGYLQLGSKDDVQGLADTLEREGHRIRVGVHDDLPVLLGADWDGEVIGDVRIAQALTSTVAGGSYGLLDATNPCHRRIATALLNAAYEGTLRAALALGRPVAVLTMIGGGAFGNPRDLIWGAILHAVDSIACSGAGPLDVIVNRRDPPRGEALTALVRDVRDRGGAVLEVAPERRVHR
jgi:hypothetical protein